MLPVAQTLLLTVLVVGTLFHLYITRSLLPPTPSHSTQQPAPPIPLPLESPSFPLSKQPFPISQWIHQSYNQSYALLDHCPPDTPFFSCLEQTKATITADKNHSSIPWWFRTIVRDSSDRRQGLHGPWHNIRLDDPLATYCAVEKTGCTQWRKMSCLLNGERWQGKPCQGKRPQEEGVGKRIVFLRDPLERFLSAYLDKCVRKLGEKHCQPNEVFFEKSNGLTEGLEGEENRRAKFEAYVDTVPLKWNLHFYPASWYCDGLYRTIHDYDFVGTMDQNFYHDLDDLGKQFGKNMTRALEQVFHIRDRITANVSNSGTETSAPDHVREFYTGRTIRRVLQYVSVDYVKLNLTVPEWAHEIMREEDSMIVGR